VVIVIVRRTQPVEVTATSNAAASKCE